MKLRASMVKNRQKPLNISQKSRILNTQEKTMTDRAVLIKEIETLPTASLGVVIDFVTWIKQRKQSHMPETMLLSESALSKDWNTPEEDEAWANL